MDLTTLIERVLMDRSINFSITFTRDSLANLEKKNGALRVDAEAVSDAEQSASLTNQLRDVAGSDFSEAFNLLVSHGFSDAEDDTIYLARVHGARVIRRCIEKMEKRKAKKSIDDEPAYLRTCLKNIERRNA